MLEDRTRLHFPASGSASLELDLSPLVLRCRAAGPGGRPLTVLIDTGTDPSAIDLGLARRLDLRLGDFALGSDAASDGVRFTETVLPWLRLGDLELRELYLLALDLSQAPFPVDLVLGYNVLSQLNLSVDYRAARITLRHPDLEPIPAPAELPLVFHEHFPALAGAELNGVALPALTLDTGSNCGLTLSPDLAERAGLRNLDLVAASGRGFASERAVLVGASAELRVGPLTLAAVELDLPAAGAGDLGRQGRANAGNLLLSRFGTLSLDYRRGRCGLGEALPGGSTM